MVPSLFHCGICSIYKTRYQGAIPSSPARKNPTVLLNLIPIALRVFSYRGCSLHAIIKGLLQVLTGAGDGTIGFGLLKQIKPDLFSLFNYNFFSTHNAVLLQALEQLLAGLFTVYGGHFKGSGDGTYWNGHHKRNRSTSTSGSMHTLLRNERLSPFVTQ